MGPYAEFGIIEQFDKTKNYFHYEPEKYNCVVLEDDVLNDWWQQLKCMKSYYHIFDKQNYYFDRWGVTLIPPESLVLFYKVIVSDKRYKKHRFNKNLKRYYIYIRKNKNKKWSMKKYRCYKKYSKYSIGKNLVILSDLVNKAINENKYIIHFGV